MGFNSAFKGLKSGVRFDVLTTVFTKIHISCEMTSCHFVNGLHNWQFFKNFSGNSNFQTHKSYITVLTQTFPCRTPTVTDVLLKFDINPLQTKRRPLYLETQSVPRCKHFSSRL